jgi:rSAM/selenodomain-associated transferase 1
VKTRLAPALGEAGAALLYRAFLEDAARCYGSRASWSRVLCAEPDPSVPPLPELFGPPWRGQRQAEGDLGARLAAAFAEEFRRGAPAALAVGSDHPALARRRIEEVFSLLGAGERAVLIPAEDGGYCVIGLDREAPVDEVFRDIPWSSCDVLEVTLERLAGAGLSSRLLPASYDVDRPEDLVKLRADVASRDPSEPDYPSATAEALATLARGGAS